MKKKWLSALLVGAMTASLFTGCGNKGDDETTEDQGAVTDVEEEAAVIDMDEEPYEVAIQVVVLPGSDYSELETEMEEKLNAITEPAINCKVDVQFVWISEVSNTTSNAIIGNEKIDLVHVATVTPLSAMVGTEMLLDLNEDDLLQTHGQDLVKLYGDLLNTGYAAGQQLAIPAKQYNVTSKGIYYNKTVADELGIKLPEKGTMEDLEKALEIVRDSDKDMIPFYVGNGERNYMYWLVGMNAMGTNASAIYGAILDEQSGNTTIENLFATDEYKDYALMINKWRTEGLIEKDTTDTTSSQDYFGAQNLFCVITDITPTLKAQYKSSAIANGFEAEFMTLVDPAVTNSAATEYMWGIAANSERPDKAMDLLNFLYTEEGAEAANILNFGLEGKNFEKTSDQVISSNGSYLASFMVIGDQDEIYVQAPSDETSIDEWHSLMNEATESVTLGYMFDDSEFQTEASALYSVYLKYAPTLSAGLCGSPEDTEKYIDEFVAALQDAGIDDVIAANQEQLDTFLASK